MTFSSEILFFFTIFIVLEVREPTQKRLYTSRRIFCGLKCLKKAENGSKYMVQGQTPKLARGTVFFSQKIIFFFVLPVIHVQMKGSRLAQAQFVDFDAK